MRTDEGDEIIEPGLYDLGDNRFLRIWLTMDLDGVVTMWACTHPMEDMESCGKCQEVDEILNAILINVIDGKMECSQNNDGEFLFRLTRAGKDAAIAMIKRITE